MKHKRFLWFLVLVPIIGLVCAMRSAASWRPQLVGEQKEAQRCVLSPDGKLLLVHDGNGQGQVWDVFQKRPLWNNKESNPHFSPDSRWMCVTEDAPPNWNGYFISLREARTGRSVRVFRDSSTEPDREEIFHDAAFSSDGRQFIIVTTHRLLRWDVATGRLLNVTEAGFFRAQLSPHEKVFSLGPGDCGVDVTSARTGRHLRYINTDLDGDNNFPYAFAPDGYSVEVKGLDGISIHRISDGKRLMHFKENYYVNSVFSPDGKLLYHPTLNGLDVYDAHTGRKRNTLPGPTRDSFVASPDGNSLYEVRNSKIYRWRAR